MVFENIQVRMPLIPNINDGIENIKAVCNFLLNKAYKSVHLLPYHSMGNSKAERIDYREEIFKTNPYTEEEIKKIKSHFSEFGINPITYD